MVQYFGQKPSFRQNVLGSEVQDLVPSDFPQYPPCPAGTTKHENKIVPDAHFQFNILESDIRPKLTLVAEIDMDNDGLLGIIRKADRSFEPISPGGFRAVNRDGYMVDLIKSAPKQLFRKEICRMGGPSDMEAVEIRNLQWLISSPKVFPGCHRK